jgi:hypothetical protein
LDRILARFLLPSFLKVAVKATEPVLEVFVFDGFGEFYFLYVSHGFQRSIDPPKQSRLIVVFAAGVLRKCLDRLLEKSPTRNLTVV